jgi:predicted enzyme related to lactoylglutathione lyase
MALPTRASPAVAPLTLGRVVVADQDHDAALAFYRAAFGARVLFDAPSPSGDRYLHLGFGAPTDDPSADGAPRPPRQHAGARAPRPARVGRQTGGQPLAVCYTPDVRAAVARAKAAGATVVRPVAAADGAAFAHVADLYGNEFVLVELTPLSGRGDR